MASEKNSTTKQDGDPQTADTSPVALDDAPRSPQGKGTIWRSFLLPLSLVLAVVWFVLLWSFSYPAADRRSVAEIIRALDGANERSFRQEAFALAARVASLEAARGAENREPILGREETQDLIRVLRRASGDAFAQAYLSLVLGRAGTPQETVPALSELLASSSASPLVRSHAVHALGLTRRAEAAQVLVKQLALETGSDRWELRWLTAGALANIKASAADLETGEIIAALRPLLADPQREVAWNTAHILAVYFDDPSGLDMLRRLLDINFLDAQRDARKMAFSHDLEDQWMALALEGVHHIEGAACLATVRKIRDIARRRGFSNTLKACLAILQRHAVALREEA